VEEDFPINNKNDFYKLIQPSDKEKILSKIQNIFDGKSREFEYSEIKVALPDGKIRLLASRGTYYENLAEKTAKLIGIVWDVTEFKRIEQLQHENQIKLAKEFKASTVAEITSVLAHELTQPLAAIATFTQGCLQQIESGTFNVENIIYALKESVKQSDRAGQIIHRIKASTQRKMLYPEVTCVNELIESAISLLSYEKADNIIIKYQSCHSLESICVDKIQIQQVLINLLRNSFEALLDSDIINPEVIISAYIKDEEFLTVEIIDNGPGFSPIILENIFEACISTKPKGMGIGLSICRSIVEAHKGKLNIRSTQSGACVEFTLPICNE
jgi:signal transduction histidine kinase